MRPDHPPARANSPHGTAGRRRGARETEIARRRQLEQALRDAVAERRRAEERQRESESRLRLALEAAGMGVWEWHIGTNQVTWSPELEAIHGLDPRSFDGTFEAFLRDVHPEDRPLVMESIARTLDEGRDHRIEYRLVRPDGEIRWVEGRGRLTCDEAGHPAWMAGVCQDVTERRQAADVRERLAAIVESSDDAIVSKTLDGVITSWNRGAERLYGYAAAEAIGRQVSLIVPAGRHAEESDVLARLRRGETVAHFETERLAKDGRTISVSLTSSPVRNALGQIVGVSKVARDITHRKRIDAAREEFLSIAAHELRNPLNALQLQLTGLQRAARERERPLPKAWLCDRVDQVVEDVGRLADLVHRLLDVSRISAGHLELELEDLEFGEVIQAVVDRLRHQVGDGPVTLDLAKVSGRWDRLRLDQIVTNLVSNALKYGRGRPVEVALTGDATMAHLSVTDHGIGIDPEHQERLFERFERAVACRHYGGFGLGLWITRQIVGAMGGHISVESRLGTGSTIFTVALPRRAPAGHGDRSAP